MNDKIVVFLHIPKTGGTTLHTIFKRNFQPHEMLDHLPADVITKKYQSLTKHEKDSLKAVSGHFSCGILDMLLKPYSCFTMFRDPVKRVVSEYYFLKNYEGYKESMKEMSLEEFIEWYQFSRNGQTKVMCGYEALDVELAKQNVNKLDVFGLTEMFNESLYFLQKHYGWRDVSYTKQNITKNRPSFEQIDPSIIKKISAANQLDIELYEYAKSLFIKRINQLSLSEQKTFKQFQRNLSK